MTRPLLMLALAVPVAPDVEKSGPPARGASPGSDSESGAALAPRLPQAVAGAGAAGGTGPISDSGAGYYPVTLGAGLVRAALRRCRGHRGLCGPAPELSALSFRVPVDLKRPSPGHG